MQTAYQYPKFDYQQTEQQRTGAAQKHPVIIVGGGPIGLTAALDFAKRGIKTILLDEGETVSVGSRAVCYAKRPLEIWDRLGCGERMVDKGVSWQRGKVFFKDDLAYTFDLLPEDGHKMPAMINLQQYYLEEYLVEQCQQTPDCELLFKHKVIGIEQNDEIATLTVETPDGCFKMQADWVLACDGAGSHIRKSLGQDFAGQRFQDQFLIADVIMKADFPTERWFWFDPPFHRGWSVLLHKQCDNVWRIDFQLGPDADPAEEKKPENVIPRIKAMLGANTEFELEWVSIYRFACRRVDEFRNGRIIFAGDSAHQVSPFGARGANTGVQDVDNLGWKLKRVIDNKAPVKLLDSYHEERAFAADDNLFNSTASTDFISPKSRSSLRFRDAVLELAKTEAFARPMVNSGRLSTPTPYFQSSLNTPDTDSFLGLMCPGTPCADAPLGAVDSGQWLLSQLGDGFTLIVFGGKPVGELTLGAEAIAIKNVGDHRADIDDQQGLVTKRYDGKPGTCYLIRPDQHVAARWRSYDEPALNAAIKRCTAA